MVGGGFTVAPGDAGYPRRLVALARPPVLHGQGALAERAGAVALVGSRAAPRAVLERAHALGRGAAAAGHAVISGGALGVDTAAHRGALDGGGHTVVVLGTGLDVLYPARNHGLFAAIVAAGGALVSTFAAGEPPRRGHFVARNRVIAGLADLIVVVGAAPRSGSLHTARAAVALGRRLAAVPGTAGTDALLAAGAALIETPADLDAALAGAGRRPARRALDPAEAALVDALDPVEARDPAELAAALGLRVGAAFGMLAALAQDGWAVPAAGGYLRAL